MTMKKKFPLKTRVKFIKTGSDALENQTGIILGKSSVNVDDHYIVLLDVPTTDHLAISITEHCLETV